MPSMPDPRSTFDPDESDPERAIHGSEPAKGRAALLVEDEETIRRLTRGFLEGMGFSVTEARNGLEGLERFRASPDDFDIVVVDLVMPELSGRQMIERLRPTAPTLPILIMSGATDATVRDLLDEPTISFLAKPFRAAAFRDKVSELVEASAGP